MWCEISTTSQGIGSPWHCVLCVLRGFPSLCVHHCFHPIVWLFKEPPLFFLALPSGQGPRQATGLSILIGLECSLPRQRDRGPWGFKAVMSATGSLRCGQKPLVRSGLPDFEFCFHLWIACGLGHIINISFYWSSVFSGKNTLQDSCKDYIGEPMVWC